MMKCLIKLCLLFVVVYAEPLHKKFCIVGAGPAGLQLGYFMSRQNKDYIILEKGEQAGWFFTKYPRHDKLISINKRHTGKTNDEFNMRHDWNSLINDDPDLRMTKYSREFFPDRRVLLKYLEDYRTRYNISVKFNTEIISVKSPKNQGDNFKLTDKTGGEYSCQVLVMATGYSKENLADESILGSEYITPYSEVSVNPDDFEGKSVLILGGGNSAMEVADRIVGSTNMIHIVSRSRVKLAWETHYVGDVRAVNNGLLDTYQLKSLDGVLEADIKELIIIKDPVTNRLLVNVSGDESLFDNFALRDHYDVIVSALGFKYDFDIFDENHGKVPVPHKRYTKFPKIKSNFESPEVPGMYFAGTSTHSLDFKRSAGGFIHGYRYTARSLFHILNNKYESISWPVTESPFSDLMNTILKRINEASGTYQMFGVLGDVYLINDADQTFKMLEEYPLDLVYDVPRFAGHNNTAMIIMNFEYGKDFSGPGKDIFRSERATGEPSEGHLSNFLHPVFYYYKTPPTEQAMERLKALNAGNIIPRPDRLHHIVEDFTTDFDASTSHILPLRRFLETSLGEDMRTYSAEACFYHGMTSLSAPRECEQRYMNGEGLLTTTFHPANFKSLN